MTSGEWITYSLLAYIFVIFPIWEVVQLLRRRAGNKSALTLSQYVTRNAKKGSEFWEVFIVVFPLFLLMVSIWLLFHFEGLCINFGFFCDIDV